MRKGAARLGGLFFVLLILSGTAHATEYLRARDGVPVPVAVADAAVVTSGGKVFCIGGRTAAGPSKDVWAYDPVNRKWTPEFSLEEARYGHAAVAFGDRILVLGGMRIEGTQIQWATLVEELDVKRGKWRVAGTMPFERARFGAVALGTNVLIIGGLTAQGRTSRVDVLQPATLTWSRGVELPEARSACAAVLVGSSAYVIGGEGNPDGAALNTVLRLSAADSQWRHAASMRSPRRSPAVTRIGTRVVVVGGTDGYPEQRALLRDVEVLDTVANAWDVAAELGEPREGAGAATINGTAYVVGRSVTELAWASSESRWRVDEDLRFHLAWYRERPAPPESVPLHPLGYSDAATADVDNIDLGALRDLGFPVPERDAVQKWTYYLKFFAYPAFLDPDASKRGILEPLQVPQLGQGAAIEPLPVVIKSAVIERTDWRFNAQHPFPTPRLPRVMVRDGTHRWTPQKYLDDHVVFSSVYVKPVEPAQDARGSAEGVVAFHGELTSLYRRSLEEKAPGVFLDDSDATRHRLIRVGSPMVFDSWKSLPMPQGPNLFLSGLLLLRIEDYTQKTLTSGWVLDRVTVFEIGSVFRTP